MSLIVCLLFLVSLTYIILQQISQNTLYTTFPENTKRVIPYGLGVRVKRLYTNNNVYQKKKKRNFAKINKL